MGEVSRRMRKPLATLASELNPRCSKAKFGLDELQPLCSALREMGWDRELDGILHDYFESLRQGNPEPPANDELLPLVSTLMENTGTLANTVVRVMGNADESELRQVAGLLRGSLLPTALRLGSLIDNRLHGNCVATDKVEPCPDVQTTM